VGILTVPAGFHLGHKSLLLRLSGFQKRSTRMNILAKRNILFAHISPSVKMRSATDLARLPEGSAPLQKVDFRGIAFPNHG
jgi:hypothetical protein